MKLASFRCPARLLRAPVATAALLGLFAGSSVAAAPGADPELQGIRNRLEKANAQTAQVMNELKALDREIFAVAHRVERQESELASLEVRIRNLKEQTVAVGVRRAKLQADQNRRARRIYKDGPVTVFAALFAVRTLTDLPKLSIFWKNIFERDARAAAELIELAQKLESEQEALGELSAAAAKRGEELKETKRRFGMTRAQRSSALKGLRQSILEAMAAEKALLAARAAAEAARAAEEKRKAAAAQVRPSPGPCVPGNPTRDRRLAALLDWYAPAAGPEPFMPPRLGATDVVFNGVTSWYGPGFEGCATSSGATFRSDQMTAASLSLPMGTLLKVTAGGKSVVVVITDRGPYIQGRDLDLSRAAAAAIGATGVATVRMEVLLPNEPAPPFP